MAISDASTRYVVTLGAGASSTSFLFDYLDKNNIKVYFNDILKTYGTDYTINNKTVTFTNALTSSTKVSIISTEPYGSGNDFIEAEEWSSLSVNKKIQHLALLINQVRDQAVLVGNADASTDVVSLIEKTLESALDAVDKALEYASNALAYSQSAYNFSNLAEDWATKIDGPVDGYEYSAKYWANAASSIVIPDGSINNAKINQSSNFTFNQVTSTNGYRGGQLNLSSNGTQIYGPFNADTGFICQNQNNDSAIEIINNNFHEANGKGIKFSNFARTIYSDIYVTSAGGRFKININGTDLGNILSEVDIKNEGANSSGFAYNIMGIGNCFIVTGIATLSNVGGNTWSASFPLSSIGLNGKTLSRKCVGSPHINVLISSNPVSITSSTMFGDANNNQLYITFTFSGSITGLTVNFSIVLSIN